MKNLNHVPLTGDPVADQYLIAGATLYSICVTETGPSKSLTEILDALPSRKRKDILNYWFSTKESLGYIVFCYQWLIKENHALDLLQEYAFEKGSDNELVAKALIDNKINHRDFVKHPKVSIRRYLAKHANQEILELLRYDSSSKVRMKVVGYINNPEQFLNDSTLAVRKALAFRLVKEHDFENPALEQLAKDPKVRVEYLIAKEAVNEYGMWPLKTLVKEAKPEPDPNGKYVKFRRN